MKRILTVLAILLVVCSISSAQGTGKGKMSAGAALNLGLPMGDFANGAGFGFGGSGRFQYGLTDQMALDASIGYISFAEKNSVSTSALPILAGVRYYFMPGGGVYGNANLGLTSVSSEVNFTFFGSTISASASSTNFSLGLGGGYETGMGTNMMLDIGANFNFIFTSGSTSTYIGIRAGVNFGL